jgi:hypothetical protein
VSVEINFLAVRGRVGRGIILDLILKENMASGLRNRRTSSGSKRIPEQVR